MNFWKWLSVLAGAFLLAIAIRLFAFETVRVATEAMSESQQVGNRLLISKWQLGARLPMSVGIPFAPDTILGKPSFIKLGAITRRFNGKGSIQREDVLAYNSPLQTKQVLDRRSVMIGRCVALPGETLHLKGSSLFIDGKKVSRNPDVCYCYGFNPTKKGLLLQNLNSLNLTRKLYVETDTAFVYLTAYDVLSLRKVPEFRQIDLVPVENSQNNITIQVPKAGQEIELCDSTVSRWGGLLRQHEGITLKRLQDGRYSVNNHITNRYRFQQNYYFVLNDHQGYLDDSRSFGPVPESHIIGKAGVLLFSPTKGRFLQKI